MTDDRQDFYDWAAEAAQRDGCFVVHPYPKSAGPADRSPEANLEEAVALAESIGLEVLAAEAVALTKPRPATYLGKGAVERLGERMDGFETCEVVVVDTQLSPVQQRNLETAWKRKVIDRTGLILEIFGARARTREGRLQVDLAAQTYQLGRLVRSWTHLERQRGGAGFMGGPGERQIELDRRMIRQRISRLKRELAEVKRTRSLQRQARQRVPYPVVALVGYTNAGKSTLFNRLTGAAVEAKDQLFATLDPTMRRLDLPSGRLVILSDTVGFVSNLPHELVNAFHATLEEVVEADLVLHVRDISHEDTEAQRGDVLDVLTGLGVEDGGSAHIIEVLNKIDLLDDVERAALEHRALRAEPPSILVSAATGQGCAGLIERIDGQLAVRQVEMAVDLGFDQGALVAWVYDHGEVLSREDDAEGIHLRVRVDSRIESELKNRIGGESV